MLSKFVSGIASVATGIITVTTKDPEGGETETTIDNPIAEIILATGVAAGLAYAAYKVVDESRDD